MAQGPHPWPPRGPFWPPPPPPNTASVALLRGLASCQPAQTSPGTCSACLQALQGGTAPLVDHGGRGWRSGPPPTHGGGAGYRWGSFLEVSGKSPARCFGPNCTTMGQGSTHRRFACPMHHALSCGQGVSPDWWVQPAMAHSGLLGGGRLPPGQIPGSFRETPCKTLVGQVAPQWGRAAQI